jgi:hypothetical protein
MIGLAAFVFLAAISDPTSLRAIAARNEAALVRGEEALDKNDATAALSAAMAVTVSDKRLDTTRFLWLRARARFASNIVDGAIDDARTVVAAINATDARRPTAWRLIASAERARGHFDMCATAHDELLAASLTNDDRLLWGTCLRGTDSRTAAHDVIAACTSRACRTLRIASWIEDGVPQQAHSDVDALLRDGTAQELRAVADALWQAGDRRAARSVVDAGVARFPNDAGLAQALLRVDDHRSVSRRAAAIVDVNPDRLRAGDNADAWRATLALPEAARLRQRVALLADDAQWDRVWWHKRRLEAAKAIDDDVAYVLAYAAFSTGRFDDADAMLSRITGSAGFARATELRAAIAAQRASKP